VTKTNKLQILTLV